MFSREPEPSRPSFAAPIEPVPVPPPAAPLAIAPAPAPATTSQQSSDNIFADKVTNTNLDVTSIITKRLNAMRKLQENPMDSEAIKLMYRTQKDVRIRTDFKTLNNLMLSAFFFAIISDVCLGKFKIRSWPIYWQHGRQHFVNERTCIWLPSMGQTS